MAAPVSPEEWLPVLSKRLDERRPTVDLLRSYVNGNAPLPEAGKSIRASWEAFQKKARTNLGALVVAALLERIIVNALVVSGAAQDDDEARRIWRDNRMDIAFADTLLDMFTCGIGYMALGIESGRPVITSEKPEFVYAATDPLLPWRARAVLKVWRDNDAELDYGYVWANGVRQKFERPAYTQGTGRRRMLLTKVSGGDWQPTGEAEPYEGDPPVYVFPNVDDMGEFQAHTDIIDRINKGILDRLVASAYQAFRQRALQGGLPKTDPDTGKEVDYSAIFAPAPGALWDLPEGITIWESQESAQSIQAMLMAVKDDMRDFSAVTRTPLAMLAPDGQNQSATGSEFAKEGLVLKAKDRISRVKPPLSALMTRAMQIVNPDFDRIVEAGFADPTHVTTAERYDAAAKAQAAGVPWRTIMIDILGFSAEKVDEMQTEREEELLTAALAAPPAAPVEPQNAAQPA